MTEFIAAFIYSKIPLPRVIRYQMIVLYQILPKQSQISGLPFPRVAKHKHQKTNLKQTQKQQLPFTGVATKKWKKKHTAISFFRTPFSKGCHKKKEEKIHSSPQNQGQPFLSPATPSKKSKKNTHTQQSQISGLLFPRVAKQKKIENKSQANSKATTPFAKGSLSKHILKTKC